MHYDTLYNRPARQWLMILLVARSQTNREIEKVHLFGSWIACNTIVLQYAVCCTCIILVSYYTTGIEYCTCASERVLSLLTYSVHSGIREELLRFVRNFDLGLLKQKQPLSNYRTARAHYTHPRCPNQVRSTVANNASWYVKAHRGSRAREMNGVRHNKNSKKNTPQLVSLAPATRVPQPQSSSLTANGWFNVLRSITVPTPYKY